MPARSSIDPSLASRWLLFDHHTRAIISILSAFKLLNYNGHGIGTLISITIHEALLNIVKALACLCLVLLADMFRSVSKTCLLEEVKLRTLIEAWIAEIFVGVHQLHKLIIFGDTELV